MSALDKLQGLLGKSIRVLISDGRVVQGDLQCIDKDMNIILASAVEFYGITNGKVEIVSTFNQINICLL